MKFILTNIKTFLSIVLILATLFLGYKGYSYISSLKSDNSRLHSELVSKTTDYEQLSKYVAKLEITYSDYKELEARLKGQFDKERAVLEGRIKVLSNATFMIREAAKHSKSSDITYSGDSVKYVVNELSYEDGPPIGYILIFDNGEVVTKLYNHEFKVYNAISRNEDTGIYTVLAKATYVLKSPSLKASKDNNWFNKEFELPITGGSAVIDPTEKNQSHPHLHLWAPHINGGLAASLGGGGVELRPLIDLSLAGYGPTKNDLDWKFLSLGIDTDSKFLYPGAHLYPVSYRFFPSLLTNTYLSVGVGWNSLGSNFQGALSLGF